MKIRKSLLIFLCVLALSVSQIQSIHAASRTSRIMLNAGLLVSLSMDQFDDLVGLPRTNIRLAIFDGINWLEIPFKIMESAR